MLSILRKHVGWGFKVLLGIIIVSFVAFFGYNTLQQQNVDQAAIQVGEEDIPVARFQFFYENQYETFKEKFKDSDIPEFLLKSIQQSAERILVQRSLMRQFAQTMGVRVSDPELAAFIAKEKDFDPVVYKDYLKSFYNENGFSYEELVREDLQLQKFQTWAQTIQPPLPEKVTPTSPKLGLIDLWFEDFVAKTKVRSLMN